jgi:threonine/homoserine/homoserine lactone efflux protein
LTRLRGVGLDGRRLQAAGIATMDIVVPGAANLGLFIGAALVLLLVPGPAVLYIFARSVEQGRLAGLVSILGIHAATLVHVAAAALGLSALLASSALAFSVVKYAGAAYLIWLGLKKLFGRSEVAVVDVTVEGNGHRLFRDGFIVNLLNPKTALFFLAFLPQFVEADRGHVAMQIAVLGLLFTSLGIVTDGCYALAAGTVGNWLKRSRAYLEVERYVGLTAAFAGNQKK